MSDDTEPVNTPATPPAGWPVEYWCPACDVPAWSLDKGEPGWCPQCGVDPLVILGLR